MMARESELYDAKEEDVVEVSVEFEAKSSIEEV